MLGEYRPSLWDRDALEQEFRRLAFLPECCRRQRLEVRGPHPIPPATAHLWHRDSDSDVPDAPGGLLHLVMWASEAPTEFRQRVDGPVHAFRPFDVVFVDNVAWWHRTPPGADHRTRWFMAIRCTG